MDDLQQDADVQAAPRAYSFIQLAVAEGVARVTLNRPPANVLSVEVLCRSVAVEVDCTSVVPA